VIAESTDPPLLAKILLTFVFGVGVSVILGWIWKGLRAFFRWVERTANPA
jgi:hypothetical protein